MSRTVFICFVVVVAYPLRTVVFSFPETHPFSVSTTSSSSAEKTQALHTELDSVQALRGQLEEVLARTRGMALALERAAETRSDFGGGDGPAGGVASRAEGGPH